MKVLRSKPGLFCLLGLTALLSGCQRNAADELAAAQKSLQGGDRDAAIIQLSNALQLDPKLPEARALFGETLLALGNPSSAKIELQKAQELGVDTNRLTPSIARAEMATGDIRKVLNQYANTKLSSNTATAEVRAVLAEGNYSLGNGQEAERLAKEALALDPKNAHAQLIQIRRLNDSSQYEAAKSGIEQLTENHPTIVEAWLLRGDLLAKLPATRAEAFKSYEKAYSLQRKDPRALAAMATLHLIQGELDAAGKDADRLRSISRDGYLTHYMATWVKLEKGDLKGAAESSQAMLRVAPNDAEAEHLAGVVALRAGRYVQSERLLARALTEHREHTELRIQLAGAQMRMGSARKAIATLKPLLARDQPPATALAMAAEASVMAGDPIQAQTYYTDALKRDPQNIKSRIYLALDKISRGNQTQGIDDLRTAAANDPTFTADLTLIAALMELRRHSDAEAAIAAMDKKKPDTSIASHLRGQLALASGHVSDARKAWEEALRRDPAYFFAVRGLAGLDLRENNIGQAEQRLTAFLAKNPLNANAIMDLYAVKVQSGTEVSKLQNFLQSSIAAAPETLEPRIALIRSFIDNRQLKLAIEQAQAALAMFPDDRQLLAQLAQAHINNVDSTQARNTINKLRDLPGEDAEHLVAVARLQLANGEPGSAVQTLNKSISVNGDTPEALQLLLSALYKSRKGTDAEQLIRRVRTRDPVTGLIMEADWNSLNSRHADAAKQYAEAVTKRPSSELALHAMAAMNRAGLKTELARFETDWMKRYPRDVVIMTSVAERTQFAGDGAAAEQIYRRILAIQPENGFALNNLASLLVASDTPAALDFAERANRVSPNRPWFLDTWAAALAKSGDLKTAIVRQQAAVNLAPELHTHRLHLAQLLLQSGDKAGARRELEILKRLGAGFGQQSAVEELLRKTD